MLAFCDWLTYGIKYENYRHHNEEERTVMFIANSCLLGKCIKLHFACLWQSSSEMQNMRLHGNVAFIYPILRADLQKSFQILLVSHQFLLTLDAKLINIYT